MITTHKTIHLITVLSLLAVAIALPAWAQGPGGHGRFGFSRPFSPRSHHSRGVLGQLIFPCQAACRSDAESCFETANSTAVSCVSSSCATEVTAAQTACGADRSSDECEEAAAALAECADECLDAFAEAASACRETASECREACESDDE